MKFKIGDRVKVISNVGGERFDETIGMFGYVKISENLGHYPIKVKLDRQLSCLDTLMLLCEEQELKLITSKTMTQKLNSMMKRLLDAETKKLIKGGLINGDLELTEEGKNTLMAIVFETNKAKMVKIAEENIKEEKENC